MKKGSIRRSVAVSIFGVACSMLNIGCADQFFNDVLYGFALALGAIPAGLVIDATNPQ